MMLRDYVVQLANILILEECVKHAIALVILVMVQMQMIVYHVLDYYHCMTIHVLRHVLMVHLMTELMCANHAILTVQHALDHQQHVYFVYHHSRT